MWFPYVTGTPKMSEIGSLIYGYFWQHFHSFNYYQYLCHVWYCSNWKYYNMAETYQYNINHHSINRNLLLSERALFLSVSTLKKASLQSFSQAMDVLKLLMTRHTSLSANDTKCNSKFVKSAHVLSIVPRFNFKVVINIKIALIIQDAKLNYFIDSKIYLRFVPFYVYQVMLCDWAQTKVMWFHTDRSLYNVLPIIRLPTTTNASQIIMIMIIEKSYSFMIWSIPYHAWEGVFCIPTHHIHLGCERVCEKKSEIIWNAWKNVLFNALKVWKWGFVKNKKVWNQIKIWTLTSLIHLS